jgi:hypothetical protein
MRYNIATQFTRTPGPRYRTDDPRFSGEAFREDVLIPLFDRTVADNDKLEIDLDGGYGYSSSFLDEAFGGLARKRGVRRVLDRLTFKSTEDYYLANDIVNLIKKNKELAA